MSNCSYEEDSDSSDATQEMEMETPLSESSSLPQLRVELARTEEQAKLDNEGIEVAQILVDMKFSKL